MALAGGHLAVLWSLAVSQPLLDLLGKTPAFFAVRGSSPREIVAFALALTFLPPLALTAVEALAELARRPLREALHLVFVAGLVALIVLHAANRALDDTGLVVLAAALALGVLGALAYRTVPALRFAATLFLPVPLVVVALFLFASPVARLVRVDEAAAGGPGTIGSPVPVVLVVFDELPTTSLLGRNRTIDAGRFPAFASLAADATWYRDATAVSPSTESAVPAILTGLTPHAGELPTLADHPNNIFTFLRGTYDLRVTERLTHLCPPEDCAAGTADEQLSERARSLAGDAGVVYLHLVVPDALASGLPPVGDTWTDFLGSAERDEVQQAARRRGPRPLPVCGRGACAFVEGLRPAPRPTLSFFHAVLPHTPWLFLPSGRRYIHDVRAIPGTDGPAWGDDEWLIEQGYQRHLLQLGYADRVLGLILDRLRSTGVYDDALVVVTADHGHAFVPGQPRRLVREENLHELAFVPLLVKLPHQEEGRVVDGFARTTDVLPTIADALDAELTWKADGSSLLGRTPAPDGDVVLENLDGRRVKARLSDLLARRADTLGQQLAWFGEGSWDAVYRIGPHAELVGKPVEKLEVVEGPGTVEHSSAAALRVVNPASGSIPSYVTGAVSGVGEPPVDLAIAVNGRIAAVTRTEADGPGFAGLVPDDALVEGANDVRVYAVRPGSPLPLERLEGLELEFVLREDDGLIDLAGGEPIRIAAGPLEGFVRAVFQGATTSLRGWAADRGAATPAERVIVFVGDRAVFSTRSGNAGGQGWDRTLGIRGAGFLADVPSGLLPPRGSETPVRVFAVADGVAVELSYDGSFPWRTGER